MTKKPLIEELAARNAPTVSGKGDSAPDKRKKAPPKSPAPESEAKPARKSPSSGTRSKRATDEYFQQLLAEQNRDIVEWWDARSSLGPRPLIDDPQVLWNAAREYFKWNEQHPLWEQKVFAYKGDTTREALPRMRAMSLEGLCHFLDIPTKEWDNLRKHPALLPVCTRIEEVIFSQKLQGAAADLMNANIIARDLQLKDHKEHTGPGGGPMQHSDVSSLELAKAVAQILSKGVNILDLKPVNGHTSEALSGSAAALAHGEGASEIPPVSALPTPDAPGASSAPDGEEKHRNGTSGKD